jgi:hypothetical protein
MPVLPAVGSMMTAPGPRRPSASLRLGGEHHAERRAILDAAARVEVFQLGPDFRAALRFDRVQPQERRAPDQVEDRLGHAQTHGRVRYH